MITARNYAAQAERGLTELYHFMDGKKYPIDKKKVLSLASEISKAVHFALPDNGIILDDGWKGLVTNPDALRLPYPNVTLEYTCSCFPGVSKVVVLVLEISPDKINPEILEGHSLADVYIAAFAVCYDNQHKKWVPLLAWNCSSSHSFTQSRNRSHIFFTDLFDESVTDYGNDPITTATPHHESLRTAALVPILEFIEALSCKNITTEPLETISASVNARRIKDGKLPFYETKILVLDSKQVAAPSNSQGGSHASPRQHLRRGHIRRLPSGNIWVNSCIVGDAIKGVIAKSYEVV